MNNANTLQKVHCRCYKNPNFSSLLFFLSFNLRTSPICIFHSNHSELLLRLRLYIFPYIQADQSRLDYPKYHTYISIASYSTLHATYVQTSNLVQSSIRQASAAWHLTKQASHIRIRRPSTQTSQQPSQPWLSQRPAQVAIPRELHATGQRPQPSYHSSTAIFLPSNASNNPGLQNSSPMQIFSKCRRQCGKTSMTQAERNGWTRQKTPSRQR